MNTGGMPRMPNMTSAAKVTAVGGNQRLANGAYSSRRAAAKAASQSGTVAHSHADRPWRIGSGRGGVASKVAGLEQAKARV